MILPIDRGDIAIWGTAALIIIALALIGSLAPEQKDRRETR